MSGIRIPSFRLRVVNGVAQFSDESDSPRESEICSQNSETAGEDKAAVDGGLNKPDGETSSYEDDSSDKDKILNVKAPEVLFTPKTPVRVESSADDENLSIVEPASTEEKALSATDEPFEEEPPEVKRTAAHLNDVDASDVDISSSKSSAHFENTSNKERATDADESSDDELMTTRSKVDDKRSTEEKFDDFLNIPRHRREMRAKKSLSDTSISTVLVQECLSTAAELPVTFSKYRLFFHAILDN